jgi:hypothetical protein
MGLEISDTPKKMWKTIDVFMRIGFWNLKLLCIRVEMPERLSAFS